MNGDCLYPQWKTTCQKYCMENHLYEIQLNQCYSSNPNELTCKCSGQMLTDKIKNLIELNNSKSISSSSVGTTIDENIESKCLPSHPCLIGKVICNGLHEYCKCDNGTWINVQCSHGKTCQIEDSSISCKEHNLSLFSISSAISSMIINQYFILFCLLNN